MCDLIEMTYKCRLTSLTDCFECKYYTDCMLCDILDVHTGNAPPIMDYPTPTQIICRGRMKHEKEKMLLLW